MPERGNIFSGSTLETTYDIPNLEPGVQYTVMVTGKKSIQFGKVDPKCEKDNRAATLIMSSKAEKLIITAAQPPEAPSNLGLVASTCNSLKVAWDSPVEHGSEIIGLRLDAVAINSKKHQHIRLELLPDATCTVVDGLAEKTEYAVTITAITDEYFDQGQKEENPFGTENLPEENVWLPNTSMIAQTSGTTAASNLKCIKSTEMTLSVTWDPPKVFGSNILHEIVVRWAEARNRKGGSYTNAEDMSAYCDHKTVANDQTMLTIHGLTTGMLYRVVVESLVKVKTDIRDTSNDGPERIVNILSTPLFGRTCAAVEIPNLTITQFLENSIILTWEKPREHTVVKNQADPDAKLKYLRTPLLGYRLEINGKPYMKLRASASSCTLSKCKIGKPYEVVLVALSCTEDVYRERRKKIKGAIQGVEAISGNSSKSSNVNSLDILMGTDDEDINDESASLPINVTIAPARCGVTKLSGKFVPQDVVTSGTLVGDIKLEWKRPDPKEGFVLQYVVKWFPLDQNVSDRRSMNVHSSSACCSLPVTETRTIYQINFMCSLQDGRDSDVQTLQVLVPGPPESPDVWVNNISPAEFEIEWGEPRTYGAKLKGYQVYLNDRKAGAMISAHRHKV